MYKLIYARALASQMAPRTALSTSVTLSQNGYDFTANGSRETFDGWTRAYKDYYSAEEKILPGLAEHGNVNLILVGSCVLRASCGLTRQSMEQKLKELCPEITFSIRPIGTEPVAGALFWALEQAGLNGDRELEMRVRQAAESAENIG